MLKSSEQTINELKEMISLVTKIKPAQINRLSERLNKQTKELIGRQNEINKLKKEISEKNRRIDRLMATIANIKQN